jgi:2-polyprenyl-3-methyl-5-hydroxy-6-metoxy-1,4-benzoquinol methylase
MMTTDSNGAHIGTIRRVALVFDDQTRPETTGVYCRRALEKLADVTFFQPSQLAEVPRGGFDLYLNIDDGLRYLWPADLRPCAWWAIDTHIDFDWALQKARGFDLVFAAQRDGAALLRQEGVDARWLPLACDEEVHGRPKSEVQSPKSLGSSAESDSTRPHPGPLPKGDGAERHRGRSLQKAGEGEGNPKSKIANPKFAKRFDVCFVGNLIPGPRVDLVRLIQQHFKDVFVGQAYFEEMAAIYAASRIVFNRSVKNDVNMRVFEALASGSLLFTNDLADNGQAELFRDGVHLATYSDGRDLLDKLRYYLRRDDVREKIAAAGREEVLAKHTYRHRMEEILRCARDCKLQNENCKLQIGEHANAHSQRNATEGVPYRGRGNTRKATECVPYRASSCDLSYFDWARPEVLELIPVTARRVLEIGCGTGRLGEAIQKRQACEVVGIELDTLAAEKAASRLDRVLVGDVERIDPNFDRESEFQNRKSKIHFDCLVCADVLEHLVDPAGFLRRAREWLTEDAVVVASIPNVRHHSVVGGLIEGNWTYEPAGLLDNTHLHFFTRRDAEALFVKAGYQVEKLQLMPGDGYDEWEKQPDKTQVQLGRVRLTGVPPEEAQEFFVYQFLVSAKPVAELVRVPGKGSQEATPVAHPEGEAHGQYKMQIAKCKMQNEASGSSPDPEKLSPKAQNLRPKNAPPRCVLLMITYNRLEYTRLALEAVLKLDYPNLRIVVWDNASTDGTVEYLRERLLPEHRWTTGCNAARPHPGPGYPLAGAEGAGAERHRGRSLQNTPDVRLILSPVNRGVVFPMNEAWASDPEAELLAKIDNDTLVPPDLLRRLAECHLQSKQFGVLSGFHFRQEGEALAEEHRIKSFDGVRVLPQPYVGGCAVMIRAEVFKKLGMIGCRSDGPQQKPFMDSGWTLYQQRLTQEGLVNGYPWPPIHVDHMEDTRSPHCIRSAEHQCYKRDERGMGLEEFTKELCVWRPNWTDEPNGDGQARQSKSGQATLDNPRPAVHALPAPSDDVRSYAQIRFQQDFANDFEQFDFWGKPFAFARFADGERAICMGQPIQGQDGWSFDGRQAAFAEQLNAALRYDAPGYFIGISDGCCDRPAKEWYLQQIKLPVERVTFSNIFVNANYRRFKELDTGDMAIIASEGGDYGCLKMR